MRVLHLLFMVLLVCLLPLPGFSKDITNPVSCFRNKGACVPFACAARQRQVGTCGLHGLRCCRKK
uniref:Beta/alpha-defensin C-terminal domain-containing protein n=1 Tax=Prolemur simus TaxID=1328070 RepID=A0A8C8YPH5_PROSS